MAQKGINLGGWLVLEKWITPSLFKGTAAQDEFQLVSCGDSSAEKIKQHYNTFITEEDMRWLAQHNVAYLRVPIGYWLFGDQAPFLSTVTYLDQLFTWADTYNMNILLSIHGAPGSQNGKHHSGKIGDVAWKKHQKHLFNFIKKITHRYKSHESFWGIGLLNEPHPHLNNFFALLRYYTSTTRWLKQYSPHTKLYLDGTFNNFGWALVALILRVGLDIHLYHGFGGADYNKAMHRLQKKAFYIRQLQRVTSVIIGEWSGVISKRPSAEKTRAYIQKQQEIYGDTTASFYWTYKTEQGGSWNFQDITNKKLVK